MDLNELLIYIDDALRANNKHTDPVFRKDFCQCDLSVSMSPCAYCTIHETLQGCKKAVSLFLQFIAETEMVLAVQGAFVACTKHPIKGEKVPPVLPVWVRVGDYEALTHVDEAHRQQCAEMMLRGWEKLGRPKSNSIRLAVSDVDPSVTQEQLLNAVLKHCQTSRDQLQEIATETLRQT